MRVVMALAARSSECHDGRFDDTPYTHTHTHTLCVRGPILMRIHSRSQRGINRETITIISTRVVAARVFRNCCAIVVLCCAMTLLSLSVSTVISGRLCERNHAHSPHNGGCCHVALKSRPEPPPPHSTSPSCGQLFVSMLL